MGSDGFSVFHNREWVRLAVSNLVLQAVVLASIRIASMCTAFRDSINETMSFMAFRDFLCLCANQDSLTRA